MAGAENHPPVQNVSKEGFNISSNNRFDKTKDFQSKGEGRSLKGVTHREGVLMMLSVANDNLIMLADLVV